VQKYCPGKLWVVFDFLRFFDIYETFSVNVKYTGNEE